MIHEVPVTFNDILFVTLIALPRRYILSSYCLCHTTTDAMRPRELADPGYEVVSICTIGNVEIPTAETWIYPKP
jgi:hypothetical protein